jgi:hypothetical protein
MWRATAAGELLAALEVNGVLPGCVDLSVVWPVVAAWWRTPAIARGGLAGLACYPARPPTRLPTLRSSPASRQPCSSGRSRCASIFGREFVRRTGPTSTVGLEGGASVSLWYAASAPWEALSGTAGWIAIGLSTPNIDAIGDGRDRERLITSLEQSALFQVALAEPVRALVCADDGPEDLTVPATRAQA